MALTTQTTWYAQCDLCNFNPSFVGYDEDKFAARLRDDGWTVPNEHCAIAICPQCNHRFAVMERAGVVIKVPSMSDARQGIPCDEPIATI